MDFIRHLHETIYTEFLRVKLDYIVRYNIKKKCSNLEVLHYYHLYLLENEQSKDVQFFVSDINYNNLVIYITSLTNPNTYIYTIFKNMVFIHTISILRFKYFNNSLLHFWDIKKNKYVLKILFFPDSTIKYLKIYMKSMTFQKKKHRDMIFKIRDKIFFETHTKIYQTTKKTIYISNKKQNNEVFLTKLNNDMLYNILSRKINKN